MQRHGRGVDVLDGDRHRRVAVKRRTPRQHFIHHNAQRVQIGACIDVCALRLLRRDIMHRPQRLTRERILRGRDLRDAEIGDLHAAVLEDHDVVGLNVAVDDAAAVRVLQRLGDLRGKMQRLAPTQLPLLLHILLERDALDELHDDVVDVVRVRHIVNAHDIRVRQHRHRLRLRVEAAAELLVLKQLFLQDLDGNEAVEAVASRLVYHRHAARADQLQDLIAIIQQRSYVTIHKMLLFLQMLTSTPARASRCRARRGAWRSA